MRDRGQRSRRARRLRLVEPGHFHVDGRAPDAVGGLFQARFRGLAAGRRHRDGIDLGLHGAAFERQFEALGGGDQPLLLEVGLLHQPVRQPAQQVGMRPPALEAARPQPRLIRRQQRDATLALAVEHQQRPVLGARQHGAAAVGVDVDLTEPAAPGRLLCGVGIGAGEALRDRMLQAVAGQFGLERGFDDATRGHRRQHRRQRRARQAQAARVIVAGRHQQRAAVLIHVARDVVVVEHLQDAAMLVAVEDDEIELVDLLREQLARREGDQRQLVDRRAVLLLRGAQNGEMHEVDGGIRFEQVAPGALAGVRLARDQQHAQVLAHAFRRDDDAVVGGGEFARNRRQLDLDDVGAGMWERHRHLDHAVDGGLDAVVGLALAANFQADGVAPGFSPGAGLAHGDLDVARLADDAVAGRFEDLDAAVELAGLAGQQRVDRCVEAQARGGLGHIMDLPVGDHDDAGQPVGRRVGQRLVQVVEQVGARGAVAGPGGGNPLDLEVLDLGQLGLEVGANGGHLRRTVLQRLARRLVGQHEHDVGEAVAALLAQRRIEQGEQQRAERQRPEQRAARAPQQQQHDEHEPDDRGQPQQRPRQHRREINRPAHFCNLLPVLIGAAAFPRPGRERMPAGR